MAKRKKPCDVHSITTFFAKKSKPGIGPSIDSSTSMSLVRVSLPLNPLVDVRLRVVSLLLSPGDVNTTAEYDVGKLLDLLVNLKHLSLKYNCLLKIEPGSNPSSYPLI